MPIICEALRMWPSGLEALARSDTRLQATVDCAGAGPVPLRLHSRAMPGLPISSSRRWCRGRAPRPSGARLMRADRRADDGRMPCWRWIGDAVAGCGLSRRQGGDAARLLPRLNRRGVLDLGADLQIDAGGGHGAADGDQGHRAMDGGGLSDVLRRPSGYFSGRRRGACKMRSRHAFGLATRAEGARAGGIARNWAPWRSVAARLFWAYYSQRNAPRDRPFGLAGARC